MNTQNIINEEKDLYEFLDTIYSDLSKYESSVYYSRDDLAMLIKSAVEDFEIPDSHFQILKLNYTPFNIVSEGGDLDPGFDCRELAILCETTEANHNIVNSIKAFCEFHKIVFIESFSFSESDDSVKYCGCSLITDNLVAA